VSARPRGPVRLAHLVSHPIQYFAPLYRELAQRPEVDLTVFFYSDESTRGYQDVEFGREIAWDVPLLEGYRHRIMPSARRRPIGPFAFNPDVVRAVDGGPFDAVWAHGYVHATAWLAWLSCLRRRRPFLMRDESILGHERAAWKDAVKAPPLRALLATSSWLYIGSRNREYVEHYGGAPERMFFTPYCVDNATLQAHDRALRPRRAELRREFGIADDRPVILFSGKLIDKKQPLETIEAFARLRAERECALLLAGDGELRGEAEALVERLAAPDVHFAGFLNQSELPRAYVAADAFVLFSGDFETWGLVVNEAMNFGLPVVTSDKVGSSADLVDGNGRVVAHDDVEALAEALGDVIGHADRDALGRRSREIVDGYSIARCADGIVEAALTTTGRG
jgi:glycosyltransferase involved in cell wall biosynthesis